VEGGRSSSDLSEGEKDSTRFESNLVESMPNVTGFETTSLDLSRSKSNIVES